MHEAKLSAVLESRLYPKCNNLHTCTSVSGALTGLQCKLSGGWYQSTQDIARLRSQKLT